MRPWLDGLAAGHELAQPPAPWLSAADQSLRCLADKLAGQGLSIPRGLRLQRHPGQAKKETLPYELAVFSEKIIPCRLAAEGFSAEQEVHDFFNLLAWLNFPRSKATLNRLQAEAIQRHSLARGRLRDWLTVIDENALVILNSQTGFAQQLAERRWHQLFVDQRPSWQTHRRVLPLGHALLQKLQRPFKAITAHTLILNCQSHELDAPQAEIDRRLSLILEQLPALASAPLARPPWLAMPVLGIPGWCKQNEDPQFYQDSKVFRPP